jgi:hypothetical protein
MWVNSVKRLLRNGNPFLVPDLPSRKKEVEYFSDYALNPHPALQEDIFFRYRNIAKVIVRDLAPDLPYWMDRHEAMDAADIGLLESIEDFDLKRNYLFKTFAYHRVRGSVLDEVRSNVRFYSRLVPISKLKMGKDRDWKRLLVEDMFDHSLDVKDVWNIVDDYLDIDGATLLRWTYVDGFTLDEISILRKKLGKTHSKKTLIHRRREALRNLKNHPQSQKGLQHILEAWEMASTIQILEIFKDMFLDEDFFWYLTGGDGFFKFC